MDRNQEAESIAEAYCKSILEGNSDSTNQELFMTIGADMLDIEDVLAWLEIQLSTQSDNGQILGTASREGQILPLHAVVVWRLYQSAADDQRVLLFIQKNYSRCLQWHSYFYDNCNPLGNGLIEANAEEGLIDPFYNSILCWSNQCLLELGYELDLPSGDLFEQNEWTLHSMNEFLWDEGSGMYLSYDSKNGKSNKNTSLGFLPMLAEVPEIDRAISIVKTAFGNRFRQEGYRSLPSLSFDAQGYDPSQADQGAISISTNWLFVNALGQYGFDDMIEIVRNDSLKLLNTFGFCPYFDPNKSAITNGFGNKACPIAALIYLHFHSSIKCLFFFQFSFY